MVTRNRRTDAGTIRRQFRHTVRSSANRSRIGMPAIVALVMAFGGVARGQDDAAPVNDFTSIEQRPGYVEAVRQIATGEERAGLATLEKLATDFPADPDLFLLHYNAACGRARLKELDAAFDQLDLAVTGGYPIHPLRREKLDHDPDLAPLRADPRFAPLRERARAMVEAIAGSWDQLIAPYEWVPPPPDDPAKAKEPLPLLIVLHPYAEERAEYAHRLFEPFCAQHRFALFAPGGRQIVAPDRFAWFGAAGEFINGFRWEQREIVKALDEFKKRVAIDPARIYVAGVGQGAGLGFAIAMRNPQWVRGAVLFHGGYAPVSLRDWNEAAAQWGRRVAWVHGESVARYPLAPLEAYAAQLQSQGLAVRLFPQPGDGALSATAVAAALAERLPWIDEVPFERPKPAGR